MRRTFLGWDGPALPLAARALVDACARDGEARMDRAAVALPGRRAGRRLQECLVEEAGRRGFRLVPPRVVTVGALPELLYERAGRPASAAARTLAWAAALAATPTERLGKVFARRPEAGRLAEWAALAGELARLHREVAQGGHAFSDVATRCRAAARAGRLAWDDAERWEVLAGVRERYEERLASAGLVDPDAARIRAVREGRVAEGGDVWLVGVAEMPALVRDAVRGVADRAHALVHAPESRADAFDELGCVVPEAWADAGVPVDDRRTVVADRPADQAAAVLRVLAELDGRHPPDGVVIASPDRSLTPWLVERLEGAGVPVRDAAGTPVERTGPFRLLRAVGDFLDGRRFEAFAALVRHPDVARWLAARPGGDGGTWGPDAHLIPLDRWYAEHLPDRLPPALSLPGADRPKGRAVAALLSAVDGELLDGLAGGGHDRPLGSWCRPALELLHRTYGAASLDPTRPDDRRTLRALALVADAIHAFATLPDGLEGRCDAAAAIRLFLDHAAGGGVPTDAGRPAVEIVGWLELHLDDAPVAVLAGANEPWLPESVRADAFLPDRLRTSLGLLDDRLRHARDAYRLTAAIHAREVLHLVVGRWSPGGDPLRPSRLLFAADPDAVARRVRRLYDREPGGEARGDVEDGGQGGFVSGFRLPPEPTIVAPSPDEPLRVTDFGLILTDPYAFALRRYRGCEPLDDAAREMDPLLFGGVAHRILERFGRTDVARAGDEPAATGLLDRLLDEEARARFGGRAHAAVRIQVERLRTRLRRFARRHAEWIAEGWRIEAVECSTSDGGAPFEVDGKPIGISARIDRVDRHPDRREWAVFDYKTSDAGDLPETTHRAGRDGAWRDLQLPLYRWLLPRVVDPDGRPLFPDAREADVRVGYVLLPADVEGVGFHLAEWSEDDFASAYEAARDVVRTVRSGCFTFDPDARPSYPEARMEALLGRGQLAAATGDEGDTGPPEGG